MRLHHHTAGHIRGHGYKSHDIWKGVEYFGREDIIQCVIYTLTLRCTHMSGMVHTEVEVHRIYLEMSRLVE